MPNVGYHLARRYGYGSRAIYSALLPRIIARRPIITRSFPLDVYAYSGEAMLAEQVASIRSFLRNAGRPPRFTVVSDGSYTARSLQLLRGIDESVATDEVRNWLPPNLPADVYPYLTDHPTGRQLALIMSLPKNGPAVYSDSDILFFPGADELLRNASRRDASALYLRDCRWSGDERLLRPSDKQDPPVNTGFLLLFRPLDWTGAVERFRQLDGAPNFFTNQTLTHIAMHENSAAPFDAAKCILQLDDQFVFPDRYASDAIALRHYVNPVRHKFWTSLPFS